MQWYYAESGVRAGPIPEAQLEILISDGHVTNETLVWREGMPDWLPLSEARQAGGVASPPPPHINAPAPGDSGIEPQASLDGRVVCVECGKRFHVDDTIRHGTIHICALCKPRFVQKLREGLFIARAKQLHDYGGFWLRFAAKCVDGLLLGLTVMGPLMGFIVIAGNRSNPAATGWLFALVMIVGYGVVIAYHTYCVGKWGATPGKMACGLKIVTSQGEPVSYRRAFGRYWAEQLSQTLLYIGYLIAAFDDEKRTLHDHICGTRVVKK